jgi:hypothetical protein
MNRAAAIVALCDRDLAALYWAARGELRDIRRGAPSRSLPPSAEQLAGAFQRLRELDVLCDRLWREGCRRAGARGLEGAA